MKNLLFYKKKFGLFLVGRREPLSSFIFEDDDSDDSMGKGVVEEQEDSGRETGERMLQSIRRMRS